MDAFNLDEILLDCHMHDEATIIANFMEATHLSYYIFTFECVKKKA